MEDQSVYTEEISKEQQALTSEEQVSSAESFKKNPKGLKSFASARTGISIPLAPTKKRVDGTRVSSSSSGTSNSMATRSSPSSSVTSAKRRNSTGGVLQKQPVSAATGVNGSSPQPEKQIGCSGSRPRYEFLTESRIASLPATVSIASTSTVSSETKKPSPLSATSRSSRPSLKSDDGKQDSVQKSSSKSSTPVSTARRILSSSLDSSGSSGVRKTVPKIQSPSARSPSLTSSPRLDSLSSSVDRSSSLSSRRKTSTSDSRKTSTSDSRKTSTSDSRKTSTSDSRDSRFMMLPQVEVKAGDDVRLDLRGHRVRSLKASGLNLSQNLEFVYLRDNLLSSLEGIEILKRVKVLDLSFNDFKGPEFEPLENCKVLQQLYLAGNQITSLVSLPQLPNLEFLSVAQNKLKSLSMASQPRLQVLAASKNKVSTLQGFPHLPALEHLRVEENPILKMPHLEAASILLVGPTLKKFNDRDLSPNEVEIGKQYPAHTALCIREGWEFCQPELAIDSTLRFLFEQWQKNLPSGYMLKEASVDQPFEEDVCRCHFIFTREHTLDGDSELVLKFQWFIGDKTPINFVPIADAAAEVYWPKREDVGKFLKVECTPILAETEYPSIFAISAPVSQGTGYPKVINLSVQGELVEGNNIKGSAEIAWCGGTPGKGVASWLRRKWNSSPVVIVGAEEEEYRLTLDDVDSSLVFMYTPVTEEGAKGEPHYAMTEFVKAAPPSVSNVRIVGNFIEGNAIKGVGEYFGGREGPSKFEWLRENKESGDFVLVSTGTAEYTLTKEDVGKCLAFLYIPINFEGQEGESMSAMTDTVKRAPPKVTNLKITGDLREGGKVSVSSNVTGGTEGSSRVQWFKTSFSKLEGENGLEALTASKIAKAFRIPLSAVDHYIVAKFTPMAPDSECGEPAYAISEKTVETLPPSLNFLTVTGDYSEGEMLTASYGYIGGREGKSLYNWYLHQSEGDAGVLITEASGLLQYRITKEAIGKIVSFRCTPVRADGAVGEPRVCLRPDRIRPGSPRLLSLQILGKEVEGSTLHVDKKYWGGEEGDSVFRWFLIRPDGTEKEIKTATSASYTPSREDIGCSICVSCEPVRSDWARGPVVLSEKIGPILPGSPTCQSLEFHGTMMEGQLLGFTAIYSGGERGRCTQEWYRIKDNRGKDKISEDEFLNLALEDVGRRVELVYTPIREDGLQGKPRSICSEVIAPANPVGLDLVIPDCYEDQEVIPRKSYYGGKEGNGAFTWYRSNKKPQGSNLENLPQACQDVVVGETLTYTPVLEDVGAYLALCWVPTRIDGKCGDPLVTISDKPVNAAPPKVSNVRIRESSSGVYCGEGDYYGGYEGSSLFSWYRETNEGTISIINGANLTSYRVTDLDYNCHLLFGYTPVRSDSIVGELRLSEPTDVILPELPKIQMLTLAGKAIEGEILTAVEVIPDNAIQKHVWKNYKKDVRYRWFISSENEENEGFEPLPSQHLSIYKLRFEDIGRCLRCECIVTDVFGRSSEPASAVTAPVLPGTPKIDKLEIEGRGFHTNLYAVRGIYSGGKEGKSRIQWLRSMVGSPDLISIPGEIGRMYEANVDDVGYRLVAVYTPIREDGVEGAPVSASTEPIAIEPDVHREVKQKLELGAVKFETLCDRDRSLKKPPGVGNLERRILEVNRKRVKVVKPGSKTSFPATEVRGTYAPPFHVETFRNDQHRLKIVVDSDNEVDLMVQTRHMRDVIVLVIRGLAQRFNSTSLNSLLKIES